MPRYSFLSTGEADTRRLAAVLATEAPTGGVAGLCGTLGSGKTRIVQAAAEALGVPPGAALSPTFVLIHEYYGRKTIYHIDAYRISSEREFIELGVDELFESDGLVLIEWADRVRGALPTDRLELEIEVVGDTRRAIFFEGLGPSSVAWADRIALALGAGSARG